MSNFEEDEEQQQQQFQGHKLKRTYFEDTEDIEYEDKQENQQQYQGNKLRRNYIQDSSDNEYEDKKYKQIDSDDNDSNNYFRQQPKSKQNKNKRTFSPQEFNQIFSNNDNQWSTDISISDKTNNNNKEKQESPVKQKQQIENCLTGDIEKLDEDDNIMRNIAELDQLSIKQLFKGILEIRNMDKIQKKLPKNKQCLSIQNPVEKTFSEVQYLEQAKYKLSESINQQIEEESVLQIDFHYLTTDNLIELVEFCKHQIIYHYQKRQTKISKQQKAIPVIFITGKGTNKTLYNKLNSYLSQQKDTYFIKRDINNQGQLETQIFI